jgi:hypothetical protein
MTNLSPAAQAILTAVTQRQYSCDPIDVPEATGRIKYEAAAALRAAASQLTSAKSSDKLRAIADELEDQ